MDLNGLILAGGSSSRMGHDKSLLDFHGKPQREFLFELLSKFCLNVYTSGKSQPAIPDHLNPLPDAFQIRGPLNGILSALSLDHQKAWLSVPVDMPYINEELLSFLIANRDETKNATCFYDSDGQFPEPLFAIWEPSAFRFMMDFYQQGKSRPREFLMTHEIRLLKSPSPLLHVNVNDPADLKNFRNRNGHSS
jgi:molybdenum cofactor guanylyltransferase